MNAKQVRGETKNVENKRYWLMPKMSKVKYGVKS